MKHSEAHAINFNYFACPMFETARFPDWAPILHSACYNLAACIAPVRRASAIQTLQILRGMQMEYHSAKVSIISVVSMGSTDSG